MAEFRIPNNIIYGKDTLAQLKTLSGQRLLLIYDTPLLEEPLRKALQPSGITVRSFRADPSCSDITRITEGTKALMEFKPEWILAAGGHTAMDLAKLIRIFYQRPDLTVRDVIEGNASDVVPDKTKLITLPLYNTNGSEATCTAFFQDSATMYQIEIRNPGLIPDMTIIDPNLLALSNVEKQAQCVLSTFVFAIEAAADIHAVSFVRPYALEAITLLSKSVFAHTCVPMDNTPLLYAQCLSGIAYTNSVPGLCSILCRTSMTFGASSFGILAAAILPAVIRLDKNPDRYTAAANAMGLSDAGALAEAVAEYADMLGFPLTLSEMGIGKNAFLKKLSKVSHSVLSMMPANTLDEKEPQKYIEKILRMAYSTREL